MAMIGKIRRMHRREKKSVRAIARATSLSEYDPRVAERDAGGPSEVPAGGAAEQTRTVLRDAQTSTGGR